MTFWLGEVFSPDQTAVVLCTEVHKRRDNVIGGKHVDVMFVYGCYESDLCVGDKGFIPPILLQNIFSTEANSTKWGWTTVLQHFGLMITP
jgi:hypothetical protein